jgi:serine/threonine protein kinase
VVSLLHVPSRSESWQLIERLGRGGEAETWRARRSGHLADEVCVKIPYLALDSNERRRVVEEARLHARVRHAHVVTLLDLVEDASGRFVIVLELVRGVDLRQLGRYLAASGTPPSRDLVASVGRAVCLALHAIQRSVSGGAVHRDVTPHNVLCSLDGEVKLADFGIAKCLSRERWTRTGHLKGKLAYVAPEVVLDEPADVRSDLFSLGVLLYELSTGTRPFVAQGWLDTLDAIAAGRYQALAPRAPALGTELVSLIERLLSARRDERPNPAEAARAFGSAADLERGATVLGDLARRARGPSIKRALPRISRSERRRAPQS